MRIKVKNTLIERVADRLDELKAKGYVPECIYLQTDAEVEELADLRESQGGTLKFNWEREQWISEFKKGKHPVDRLLGVDVKYEG